MAPSPPSLSQSSAAVAEAQDPAVQNSCRKQTHFRKKHQITFSKIW